MSATPQNSIGLARAPNGSPRCVKNSSFPVVGFLIPKEPNLLECRSPGICLKAFKKSCFQKFNGVPGNRVSINLNKIFDEGVNPVAIIRVMLNYVQRIQATQIALKKNNDFDSAIKSLKPPVFWKDKDNFKLHCKKWPIKETILNFNLLVDTELNCKSDYSLTNILCERALINIAVRGQKYFSN